MSKYFIAFWLLFCFSRGIAQDSLKNYPKVGELLSDYKFNDLANYSKKSFSISDYRGKWLVVDFWTRFCTGCIASFPKMDSLYHQMKGKADVILIGDYQNSKHFPNSGKFTKNLFAQKAKKFNLTIPVAFDSVAGHKYKLSAVPTILVINPEGKLVAKMTSIDSTILKAVMSGKKIAYKEAFFKGEPHPSSLFNHELPLLVNAQEANGGKDTAFMYRSLLTKWTENMPKALLYGWDDNRWFVSSKIKKGYAEAIGFDLRALFKIAYVGRDYWSLSDKNSDSLNKYYNKRVIVESTKKSLFESTDPAINNNLYGYSLRIHRTDVTAAERRHILLTDLHRYFGLKSNIEWRDVDILQLIVTDKKKVNRLRTKGDLYIKNKLKDYGRYETSKDESNITLAFTPPDRPGLVLFNYPISKLVNNPSFVSGLGVKMSDNSLIPKVVDCTGIDYNIDLIFSFDTKEWDEVLNVLRKNGLDIVPGKLKMKCIVVSDE